MRTIFLFKFLLLFWKWSDLIEGAVVSQTFDNIYKTYLRMRTLAFEDCGSKYDILYVNISDCEKIPCVMKRGSKAQVHVIFDDYGENTSFLKHRVHWIFNAILTDAKITPDPCDDDHACLIDNTDGKSYVANVHVNNTLPVLNGVMLWEAVDASNNCVLCFKVPVLISV